MPTLLRGTIVLVFVLVVWGGIVRLSGSGLAIPDWPLAEGKLLPRAQANVLIEYIHRVIAGLVGLLTVWIAVLIYRDPRRRVRLGALAAAALVVLAVQVFLGARVVLEELPVDRVVTHLLAAFLFFAILVRMALKAGSDGEAARYARGEAARHARGDAATAADGGAASGAAGDGASPRPGWAKSLSLLSVIAVFAQVGLGGWVSSSGAALACPDFPTCHGSWLPEMKGHVGIHYGHRLAAYAVFLLVMGLVAAASRRRLPTRAKWSVRLSGILVVLQVLLGIGNVLFLVPLAVGAAHLGTALALFCALLVANHDLSHA